MGQFKKEIDMWRRKNSEKNMSYMFNCTNVYF